MRRDSANKDFCAQNFAELPMYLVMVFFGM